MLKFVVLSVVLSVCIASKDYHSIELPVKSKHDLEVINTPSHEEESSTYVDINSGVLPVYMLFQTQSSPVYVKQNHKGTRGSYHKSNSKDEEHQLVHEVIKPVYQELREVITPYRKVIQVINALNEERVTKVHKGDSHYNNEDDYHKYNKNEGNNYNSYVYKDLIDEYYHD